MVSPIPAVSMEQSHGLIGRKQNKNWVSNLDATPFLDPKFELKRVPF